MIFSHFEAHRAHTSEKDNVSNAYNSTNIFPIQTFIYECIYMFSLDNTQSMRLRLRLCVLALAVCMYVCIGTVYLSTNSQVFSGLGCLPRLQPIVRFGVDWNIYLMLCFLSFKLIHGISTNSRCRSNILFFFAFVFVSFFFFQIIKQASILLTKYELFVKANNKFHNIETKLPDLCLISKRERV